jgi:thiamine biosynthesis lipoprotein
MTEPKAARTGMTRRRFISVLAAAGAVPLVSHRGFAVPPLQTVTWDGFALGAKARLVLQHADESVAKDAIAASLEEVARLEAILSLHRPDSALSRLNATGRIDDAPVDLRTLLAETITLAQLSGGAFDPTIQPLWGLYARHFDQPDASAAGPSPAEVGAALQLVDWQRVEIEGAAIRLGLPHMAVTLNGIAQGYITDRVGDLLRARGFEHVLVSLGEDLALGPKWNGSAWRIGIADPNREGRLLTEVPLSAGAIATSAGSGFHFDSAGRFTHILDPRTGMSARQWASVTVLADRAALADGLSTALSVAPAEHASAILTGRGRAYVVPFGEGSPQWL